MNTMKMMRVLRGGEWEDWFPFMEYDVDRYAVIVDLDHSRSRIIPLIHCQEFEVDHGYTGSNDVTVAN